MVVVIIANELNGLHRSAKVIYFKKTIKLYAFLQSCEAKIEFIF
jgi:hypothetical protein